ncbi:MAG: hypothetical protein ACJ764_06765 [Solirubrobacteraceae bacterium]
MSASDFRKAWWEQPAKFPKEPGFEPEREKLREAMQRAWRAHLLDASHGRGAPKPANS